MGFFVVFLASNERVSQNDTGVYGDEQACIAKQWVVAAGLRPVEERINACFRTMNATYQTPALSNFSVDSSSQSANIDRV